MDRIRLSNADRLRLVVAVSILRSKPKDVPVPSCVLNLYAKFPPAGSAPPTANFCWKTYALKLECDLQRLQEDYESQQIELLVARSSGDPVPDITSTSASLISHTTTDIGSAKSKNKAKKNPGSNDVTEAPKQSPHPNNSSVSRRLHDQIYFNFPREGGLLFALRVFEKAANEEGNDSTLLHATLQVLRVVARMLSSALDHHPTAKDTGYITTLGRVLHFIITDSLRLTAAPEELDIVDRLELSNVDKLFDCLIDGIFGPVIRAFKRTSVSFLLNLLSGTSLAKSDRTEKPSHDLNSVDPRPDLLRLFQTLVDSLRLAHSIRSSSNGKGSRIHSVNGRRAISISSLKASLALEVVRELNRTLFPALHEAESGDKCTDTEPENGGESQAICIYSKDLGSIIPDSSELRDRAERLIAKDTLWYLCSLMYILADLPISENIIKLHSDITPSAESGCSTSPSLPEASVTKNGDGVALLQLLHEAILSALYELVLKCQPAVSQVQDGDDGPFCSISRGKSSQPIASQLRSFITVCNHDLKPEGEPESGPMGEKYDASTFNADVSLANGARETERDSQAQGHSSTVLVQESEFGVPDGRVPFTLLDDNNISATAGGSHYDRGSVANQGRICEVISTGGTTLSKTRPELRTYSSDVAGCATGCVIDEAGFTMLLGVVERYILDPEYTS